MPPPPPPPPSRPRGGGGGGEGGWANRRCFIHPPLHCLRLATGTPLGLEEARRFMRNGRLVIHRRCLVPQEGQTTVQVIFSEEVFTKCAKGSPLPS